MGELSRIKTLDATRILDRLGIPWVRYGNSILTWAVWRGDQNPSVGLRRMPNGHWVYSDYGDGNRGGSVIDLVARITGQPIGVAIGWLEAFATGTAPDIPVPYPVPTTATARARRRGPSSGPAGCGIEILQALPARQCRNDALEDELWTHRRLRFADLPDEVDVLLLVIHPHERRRWAFGIRNVGGGIEHASAAPRASAHGFAGNVGGKHPAILAAAGDDPASLCVVEGLWDGCAVREMGWLRRILILTSTAMADRAVRFIQAECVRDPSLREICLALDDDESGQAAAARIRDGLSGHMGLRVTAMGLDGAKDPAALWVRRAKENGHE